MGFIGTVLLLRLQHAPNQRRRALRDQRLTLRGPADWISRIEPRQFLRVSLSHHAVLGVQVDERVGLALQDFEGVFERFDQSYFCGVKVAHWLLKAGEGRHKIRA